MYPKDLTTLFFLLANVLQATPGSNRGNFKHIAKHALSLRFGVQSDLIEKIVAF